MKTSKATLALIGAVLLSWAGAVAAQVPCAALQITSQESALDPGGSGTICSLDFCVAPPPGGSPWMEGTILVMYPWGWSEPVPWMVGVDTPDGWQCDLSDGTAVWTGPYMTAPVCGFGMSVHVPAGLDGYTLAWWFKMSQDAVCGYDLQVECVPTGVSESTWGILKATYR